MQLEVEETVELDAPYCPADDSEARALENILPLGYEPSQKLIDGLKVVRNKYAAIKGTEIRFNEGVVSDLGRCATREASKYHTYPFDGRPAPSCQVEKAIIKAYDRYCDIEHTLMARTAKDPARRELLLGLLEKKGAMSDNPVVLREAALHDHLPLEMLVAECGECVY